MAIVVVVVAATIATVATLVEWSTAPDVVFQGANGTDWSALGETWISWFWPVALVGLPIGVLVTWYRFRR